MDKQLLSSKRVSDFQVVENRHLSPAYSLLFLRPIEGSLKEADFEAGQFVELLPPNNATLLRRPISVCNVDENENLLWLLVRKAGKGTEAVTEMKEGESLSLIYPLGKGFTVSKAKGEAPLLIGGGVGVAPLLFLGKKLRETGLSPEFLIGAKSKSYLLLTEELAKLGTVNVTTDDGSAGIRGLVTEHPIIRQEHSMIYCCGPMPMMKAVGAIAQSLGTDCEVSLENVMGCGIGACLCCVEKTKDRGNVCVCSDGPVFNLSELLW